LSVTVRCPKCGSNAHSMNVRHPFMWGKSDVEVRCQWCGTRKYGEEARRLVDGAVEAAKRAEEAERRFREQADRERREQLERELRAAEEREREEEARRILEEQEEQRRLDLLAAELAQAELERIEAERVEAERVEAEQNAVLEARRERDRAAARAMTEKRKAVEEMVGRRLARDEAARQARRDAPRLRREARLAARATAIADLGGDASTLCEYFLCDQPHRPDLRYCSKGCSDNLARERYEARKAARKSS